MSQSPCQGQQEVTARAPGAQPRWGAVQAPGAGLLWSFLWLGAGGWTLTPRGPQEEDSGPAPPRPAPAAAARLAWVCGAAVSCPGRGAQSKCASRPALPVVSPAAQMEDGEPPAPLRPAEAM